MQNMKIDSVKSSLKRLCQEHRKHFLPYMACFKIKNKRHLYSAKGAVLALSQGVCMGLGRSERKEREFD